MWWCCCGHGGAAALLLPCTRHVQHGALATPRSHRADTPFHVSPAPPRSFLVTSDHGNSDDMVQREKKTNAPLLDKDSGARWLAVCPVHPHVSTHAPRALVGVE
jgi:hypothetical protein